MVAAVIDGAVQQSVIQRTRSRHRLRVHSEKQEVAFTAQSEGLADWHKGKEAEHESSVQARFRSEEWQHLMLSQENTKKKCKNVKKTSGRPTVSHEVKHTHARNAFGNCQGRAADPIALVQHVGNLQDLGCALESDHLQDYICLNHNLLYSAWPTKSFPLKKERKQGKSNLKSIPTAAIPAHS